MVDKTLLLLVFVAFSNMVAIMFLATGNVDISVVLFATTSVIFFLWAFKQPPPR